MKARLRVGIMGAGSIGCFLGGKLARAGATDLVLVGRERVRQEIADHGLSVRDVGREAETIPSDRFRFESEVEALRECQVVLCCVKSAQSAETARSMSSLLADDAIIVSMQNGVRNAETLRQHLGPREVLAGIVDFNVVSQGAGLYQRTTSGPLRVQACDASAWRQMAAVIRQSDLILIESADIKPDQWTKLLVNLNNAVSALSGAPTAELLLDTHYRRAVAAIIAEGVQVLDKAKIRPAKLRGVPVRWMPRVLGLPTPLVRLVTRAQMKIDPEARSSMWEDLTRGRPTEVDYLNGEVVRLAEEIGAEAPINRRIVALVRDAETAAKGSPNFSGPDLWAALEPSTVA